MSSSLTIYHPLYINQSMAPHHTTTRILLLKMKFGGVILFLLVLFTLVLISSEGRNLQISPESKINDPSGLMTKLNKGEEREGGCWKCWDDHGRHRRLLTILLG
ncbi:hypothetical protein HanXRQr2_Chr11g0468111 [Helianthus annuus]|uniref:Transmembrane protein n=1 Tax=Helianthus annuus TaxID=4232 RepID=A0A251T6C6_HELAN|nr:hypothetical protein HanXRQr2_Chr11g0468111 [Helianthus annuus]KAJ0515801.1 hypothetical protein HanHA89_Chr11g0406851 [Helianthus annuus]KAJ0873360.1 hypothetical protein HanPSC8_Chr11g0451731 [Helianthus annuus]